MHKVLIGITIGALLLAGAQKGDRADLQLQAAINKEVVEGDLKGAIEQYRKVTQSSNRAVAAKALVRMGQCYERLGDAEARKAYERVLRDFADQKDMVSQAHARLATLGSESVRATGVAVKQVWSGPALGPFNPEFTPQVGISPDGRYLTYADPQNQGSLMLRDLSNGQVRIVARNNAPDRWGAEAAVFSPDGSQIAYCVNNFFRDPNQHDVNQDLRVIKADGAGMRILYNDANMSYLEPVAWSPDQKYILIFTEPLKGPRQLVLISTADGSPRPLKTIEGRFSWRASFSPDGRYIAYDRGLGSTSHTSMPRDLFVISVDTGQEIPLVQHPADDYVLGWAPDGSGVLFVSDRTASGPAIWFQPVSQGKPSGEARFVRQITGRVSPVGWTRNGSFFYKLSSAMFDIYAAPLDPTTGKVAGTPTPVSTGTVGGSSAAVWSPDGRSLAYRAVAPLRLMIRSTGDASQRAIDIRSSDWAPEHWSADGRSIFLDSAEGILQVDAASGGVTVSVPFDKLGRPVGGTFRTARLRGDTLFWHYGLGIFTRDIRTWDKTTLVGPKATDNQNLKNFDASADGRQVVYATHRALKITAVGGATREIHQLQEGESWVSAWGESGVWGGVHFTPDGRYVLFSKTKNGVSSLWRVPAAGGEVVSLGLTGERLVDFAMSPDGRQIVFGDYKRLDPELWVMENFLPAAGQAHQ